MLAQVDGPSHFASNRPVVLGKTAARNNALRARGYTLLCLPYYEWDRMTENKDDLGAYLIEKMDAAVEGVQPIAEEKDREPEKSSDAAVEGQKGLEARETVVIYRANSDDHPLEKPISEPPTYMPLNDDSADDEFDYVAEGETMEDGEI